MPLGASIRELGRDQVRDLWSIDRAEIVENVFYHEGGQLVLKPERHECPSWIVAVARKPAEPYQVFESTGGERGP